MNLVTQNNTRRTRIVICDECHGRGITDVRVGYNEYEDKVCDSCGGSGRLEEVTDITYKKFGEVEKNA